jgi:uncharacterized protein (DUF1697 family)
VTVIVALLSAVNVGGRKAPASDLKALGGELGWTRCETLLASGNVIADVGRAKPQAAAQKYEAAFRDAFGFESAVIVRTADELDDVIARQPFGTSTPNWLLTHFMRTPPTKSHRDALAAFVQQRSVVDPYEISGAEMFIDYAGGGVAQSKLTAPVLRKLLGTPGTARNWNTVHKLSDKARAMEAA